MAHPAAPVRIEHKRTAALGIRPAYGKRCPKHDLSLEQIMSGMYWCPKCGILVDCWGKMVAYTPETRKMGEQIFGPTTKKLTQGKGV